MELSSFPIIGIALAVLSAALLTVGNHLQSVGVERAKGASTSGLGAAGAVVNYSCMPKFSQTCHVMSTRLCRTARLD